MLRDNDEEEGEEERKRVRRLLRRVVVGERGESAKLVGVEDCGDGRVKSVTEELDEETVELVDSPVKARRILFITMMDM